MAVEGAEGQAGMEGFPLAPQGASLEEGGAGQRDDEQGNTGPPAPEGLGWAERAGEVVEQVEGGIVGPVDVFEQDDGGET